MSQWVREIPTIRQQYLLLKEIWGKDVEPGYVFLPWIPGDAGDKRREKFSNGPAFAWPPNDNGEMIKHHLTQHQHDEMYFTPAIFADINRSSEDISLERALWADLDEVDPRLFNEYQPTIAWESSPGRYQAVWLFRTSYAGASNPGELNQRLSYHLGADPSGWDATQLLRVPGTKNHKRGPKGEQGYLLFRESPRPNWEEFKHLPPVPHHEVVDTDLAVLAEMVKRVDVDKVKARIRRKIKRYVWELLEAKDTGGNDRSIVIWQIAREMSDADCELEETVAVIRNSVWNKYQDRNDELKQLARDVSKTIKERVNQNLETLDLLPKEWGEWQEFNAWQTRSTPRLKWLFKDIWPEGGLGFIAGIPKSYKSWFGLHFALAISSGCEFLDEKVDKPRRVLYIQEEDSELTVRLRLNHIIDHLAPYAHSQGYMDITKEDRISWNPQEVIPLLQIRVQSGFIASDPDWQDKLETFVTEHHIEAIVIDTLMTAAGDVNIDKGSEVRTLILNPLKEMGRRLNLAICFIHHNTKGKEEKPGEMTVTRASTRMMGSGQFHAWADCGIYIRDKNANELIMEIENKSSQDRPLKIRIPLDSEELGKIIWKPEIVDESKSVTAAELKEELRETKAVSSWGKPGVVVERLRNYGAVGVGSATLCKDFSESIGYNPLNVWKQLEHAVKQGHVKKIPASKFRTSGNGVKIELDAKYYLMQ